MKVLITGADGFIGRNLKLFLSERSDIKIETQTRKDETGALASKLDGAGFVFHLAGVNRPPKSDDFMPGNAGAADALSDAVKSSGYRGPIIYTSSSQADQDNPYGASKRAAEQVLQSLAQETGCPTHIYRLPNIFGKWAKPNYNSAIATFCHNVARDLPITINDPSARLRLAYVDDVIDAFVAIMDGALPLIDAAGFAALPLTYEATVGEIADTIASFRSVKESLVTERVGTGLTRALYSTYVSALPTDQFSYSVPMHGDARGVFVEMLKTPDSGQFSYFTAHPGVTRGGHYHHSKTEKFLVIKGDARFKFRHMDTGEVHEILTNGQKAEIVETVPGWTHDITNVGDEEMVVMLWANENFDRSRPDTYACPV